MQDEAAITMLGALAQEHRIKIFRLLVWAGPSGLPSSDIADAVGISPTSASFHLKELDRTGLLVSTRQGRFIRYAVHVDGMRRLLNYLTEDCCQGNPDLCGAIRSEAFSREANMADTQPLHVLFLCTHNSARSIIAEAIMSRLGAGKFIGHSAGSQPSGRVHPFAMDLLSKLNYDTSTLRSKSWEEFTAPDAPQLDFVFTVCDNAANEVCPVWPGQPMSAHWGLPDPSGAEGSEVERRLAFSDTHRMLYQRISIFTSLPLASLDKLSLQRRLDDIGRDSAKLPEST